MNNMLILPLTHIRFLRFSDRDQLMRYHWGLAIGHLYSHPSTPTSASPDERHHEPMEAEDDQYTQQDESPAASDACESDNPELGLDECDMEGWQDVETDSGSDENGPSEDDSESEEDFASFYDG